MRTRTSLRAVEARLRRTAARNGLLLVKHRSLDPYAYPERPYGLVDRDTNAWAAGDRASGYGLTADEVEAELHRRQ